MLPWSRDIDSGQSVSMADGTRARTHKFDMFSAARWMSASPRLRPKLSGDATRRDVPFWTAGFVTPCNPNRRPRLERSKLPYRLLQIMSVFHLAQIDPNGLHSLE